MAQLLLTLIGDDREGLVQALSTVVADHGGNWLTSEMARLGGSFAGVALVDVPDDKVADLTVAVEGMDDILTVTVTPTGDEPAAGGTPLSLHLVGNDRPGIVREVTAALAAKGVGIERMHTSTRPAPMADTVLFEASADVRLPDGVEPTTVREALEALADELMVDFEVDETQAD